MVALTRRRALLGLGAVAVAAVLPGAATPPGLADYLSGSFTPVTSFGSAGRYVKIGKTITINVRSRLRSRIRTA